ncbi:hypothetical protein SDC9_110856 [bioreactor metagenome]|uniref:Uncharacterized protein n=1 Tax=bioreactor metagenome TaxID=1076179 RepID=A0A645BHE0_9ZZZZ
MQLRRHDRIVGQSQLTHHPLGGAADIVDCTADQGVLRIDPIAPQAARQVQAAGAHRIVHQHSHRARGGQRDHRAAGRVADATGGRITVTDGGTPMRLLETRPQLACLRALLWAQAVGRIGDPVELILGDAGELQHGRRPLPGVPVEQTAPGSHRGAGGGVAEQPQPDVFAE